MKNPSGNKLEKLVFGMFDQMVEGADKYVTKQGSTWLIFTEDKRWVIEFTNDKTLWFNYNLFQNELDLIGKDCTEERDLIKNWFESRFLNKPKVEEAHHVDVMKFFDKKMENTIENGVKLVDSSTQIDGSCVIEDVIQEGVKDIDYLEGLPMEHVDYTIQNGVKHTEVDEHKIISDIEDVIQNGVKETKENRLFRTIHVMNTIKNGVKHVEDGDWLDQDERMEDIIENGVKETKEISNISLMSEMFKVKAKQVIRDGVKEIQPLPAQDGNRDWGLYYHRQEDITKPHTEYVKEVIEDSYNHMGRVEGVIRNTDKDGI
jgi:predicted peroxiredoxin